MQICKTQVYSISFQFYSVVCMMKLIVITMDAADVQFIADEADEHVVISKLTVIRSNYTREVEERCIHVCIYFPVCMEIGECFEASE